MLYYIIVLTGVINAILGIMALTKGKSRLSVSFFMLSMLFAMWNIFVVMWQGYGVPVLDRVNFAVVSLIPPAGLFFNITLLKIRKGYPYFILRLYIIFSIFMSAYAASTLFNSTMAATYDTPPVLLTMFLYQFISLIIVFYILISNYLKITFKQEKTKVGYIILAQLTLFAGGMVDLMGGLGLHDMLYIGNIANTVYAGIIFYVIFRLRLFNAGVVFKNFLVYSMIAMVLGIIYTVMAKIIPDYENPVLFAVNFIITLLVVFYIKNLHNSVFLFLEKIGGLSGIEQARKSFNLVKNMQIGEEEKIKAVLDILGRNMDMETSFYLKEGDFYIKKYSSDKFSDEIVESSDSPDEILVRYDIKEDKDIDMLNIFNAAVLIPVRHGAEILGLLSGKKRSEDISFLGDEIRLLKDIAETMVIYYKTHILQQKLIDEENIKRIGFLARQMAHEIKNPLAALWGAAQLLEGKSENEKDNVDIIRDEIKRLTNILDSWKNFSDELNIDKKSVDVMQMVADVVKIVNLQDPRVEIDFNKSGSEQLFVQADKDSMKQVFINIIVNAIDAMESVFEPSLKIEVVRKQNFVDIKIRDNGCGVPTDIISRIKQPLITSKSRGTGLGLAISDKIVKEHDGALIIESDGRTYTEVTVSMPFEKQVQF